MGVRSTNRCAIGRLGHRKPAATPLVSHTCANLVKNHLYITESNMVAFHSIIL